MSRALALTVVLATSSTAHATFGTDDVVPAATLLLPYFEVGGPTETLVTTRASLVNVSASGLILNVTLWTDLGVPTHQFNVYLTGYDHEDIDLGQFFRHGILPQTATVGQDLVPDDVISPQGSISQDINFASCNGRMPEPRLDAAALEALRDAHAGEASAGFGDRCVGAPSSDGRLRGYVTIDVVDQCGDLLPPEPGYLLTLTQQNYLLGFYELQNGGQNFATADAMVHIEGTPGVLTPGTPTFYGRMSGYLSGDRREAVGARWRGRVLDGGVFADQTYVTVWREPDGAEVAPFDCGAAPPALGLRALFVFDDEENVVAAALAPSPFPRVTQRVLLDDAGLALPPTGRIAGILDIDLRAPLGNLVGPLLDPSFRNSFVAITHISQGRFMTSRPAFQIPGGAP